MKRHTRILLSLLAGLLMLYLYTGPMWWGALFPTITRRMAAAPVCEATLAEEGWYLLKSGDVTLRFRSLDLLLSFLHRG